VRRQQIFIKDNELYFWQCSFRVGLLSVRSSLLCQHYSQTAADNIPFSSSCEALFNFDPPDFLCHLRGESAHCDLEIWTADGRGRVDNDSGDILCSLPAAINRGAFGRLQETEDDKH
jgi:hypothetical protein